MKNFKYIAIQPWGEVIAFLRKPTIRDDEIENCWELQKGELSITDYGFFNKNWRYTLEKIS